MYYFFCTGSMCGAEWSIYKNHCYLFKMSDTPIKWTRAERICNMDGAHLVSIMDVNEMKFLHHMLVSDWLKGENGTYIGKVYTANYATKDSNCRCHSMPQCHLPAWWEKEPRRQR